MDQTPGAPAALRAAALIPNFNNRRTVADVVKRVLRAIPDVLVVDDGSTDGSPEALAALGERIRLLRHPRNLGKGRSLRDGFAHLLSEGFTHAIALDADGQHFPEDIPGMLEVSRREPEALIVGERDMRASGAPRRSLFGLWFSNASLRCLAGVRLRDSQSGFRCYPLQAISALRLQGDRYDLELEVILKAARAGIPIRPAPIRVTYDPEGGRVSHFRPVRDFFQIAGRVARIAAERRR